jgi:uncharacterized protein (DUF305 family)
MTRPGSFVRLIPAVLLALVFGALAGASAAGQGSPSPAAKVYPGKYPYTEADIQFVTGMISHHAQALIMAGWAPTHGASKSVRVLCERIINAQTDEIVSLQSWLRDRNQPVPEAKAVPMKMKMDGMDHEMLMPGMLSDEQMKQLDAARDTEFDRLFLTFMIQHHKGAITMVEQLLASPGAAQDEWMYKCQSDVFADQGTEIERMQGMLTSLQGK